MNEPTTTDWITAIAALFGIGPVVWGLIKLFLKDKEKEERLKFVQEQLNELKRLTSEFQHQSTLMHEANILLEKQINLQADVYLETKDVEQKKLEIENLKRISDTKPHFIFQTSVSNPSGFKIKLQNNGATAENIQVESRSEYIKLYPFRDRLRAVKGEIVEISGSADQTKTPYNSNQVTGELLLSFEDVDGREYLQKVVKGGSGYNVDPPYLRQD